MTNFGGLNGGFNFGGLFDQVTGGTGTVGTDKPEWEFPMGIERVPTDIQEMFLRGDAGPSQLNEFLQNADPKVIDRFRSAINMGIMVPKNQAATNIAAGYGGLRAGDVAPGAAGVLGPMMDDMPSGMSPEYWAQANNLVNTMVNAQLRAAEQSGYLNGIPTVQREQIMQQLAQGWKQQFTNEFLAQEQQRSNKAQEGLSQQEINNQNLQAMAGIMGGTVNPQTGEFQQTEEGRQFDTTQTGWMNGQRTLAGQAQDWAQQQDIAKAAANPRDYIYAQMLGNARGGLAGQPPTNVPGQYPGMTNATPNQGWSPLASTQAPGVSGAGTMAQMGTPGAPGQDGTAGAMGSPDQWTDWYRNAQLSQDAARAGMLGAQNGAGAGAASGLSPGPGSPGMTQPYPGYQGQDGMQYAGGSETWNTQNLPQMSREAIAARKAAGQTYMGSPMPQGGQMLLEQNVGFQAPRAAGAPGAGVPQPQPGQAAPQYTTSAFTQSLLKNRVVPQAGALGTQGQYMTQQQMQKAVNPNKFRAQDFLRGRASEQKGFLATTSAAGYDDEDVTGAMQKNLPTFKAPTAGRMV